MTVHSKVIESYGKGVTDTDVSPFESMEMLHKRSKLENVIQELTSEERMNLLSYDMQLIKNARVMAEHIKQIYDFSKTNEPLNQWWWHLDKVASGEISFHLSPEIESDMAI